MRHLPPWEVAPRGWETPFRGWDVPSVAGMQARRWEESASLFTGTKPLGIVQEYDGGEGSRVPRHNGAMAFAYVLMVAAHEKRRLRLLDWGGGVGQSALLAHGAAVETEIDYVVYDLPLLCEAGRTLMADVTFTSDREHALDATYDLIVASGSLFYERDWRAAVDALVRSCGGYLFVTRMPIVKEAASFVTIQRPLEAGYITEYLCWILNEEELVSYVRSRGMELLREFLIDYGPTIRNAPEQPLVRGYLFRRTR
jgi:putative methyltransferase (TIGR04325 family)